MSENALQVLSPVLQFSGYFISSSKNKVQRVSTNFLYFIHLTFDQFFRRQKFWCIPLRCNVDHFLPKSESHILMRSNEAQ